MAVKFEKSPILMGSFDIQKDIDNNGSNSGGVADGITFDSASGPKPCLVDDGGWGADNTSSHVSGVAPPPFPPAAPQVSQHSNNFWKLLVNSNTTITANGDPIIVGLSTWLQAVPGPIPVGPAFGVPKGKALAPVPVMVDGDLVTTPNVVTGAGAQ